MKLKIIINARNENGQMHSTPVWEGEVEILDKTLHITKILIIGEGFPQPICDIPFAVGIGYWQWIPEDPNYPDPPFAIPDQINKFLSGE